MYRRAERPPPRPSLTLRWANVSGNGVVGGVLGALAVFLGAIAVAGTIDLRDGHDTWWQRAIMFVIVLGLYLLVFLLAMFVLGTSGVTIDATRGTVDRFGGLLFIPILHSRYPLDPEATVTIESRTSGRGPTPTVTFTTYLVSAGQTIELHGFDSMDAAEAQAQRVREYLAGPGA